MPTSQKTSKISTYAIIAAGGKGERMGCNKQLMNVAGTPAVIRTMETMSRHPLIDGLILVRPTSVKDKFRELIRKHNIRNVVAEADSGETRLHSIYNGILKVPECAAIITVNGVNVFVTETETTACIKAALDYGAAVVARPAKNTIKRVSKDGFVLETPLRSELWEAETPQGMRYAIARAAFVHVLSKNIDCTDDVQVVEKYDPTIRVKVIPASVYNFKLTTPMDVMLAEAIILGKSQSLDHIHGVGEDSHEFLRGKELRREKNKPLMIGGISFDSEPGFKANSDGDVVYHSISRAILNALGGKEDIGDFADELANEGFRDSKIYLTNIRNFMEEKGYEIIEIRTVMEAGRPRFAGKLNDMRKNIRDALRIGEGAIGISPHSGEGLTSFGKGLGVRSFTQVTLRRKL